MWYFRSAERRDTPLHSYPTTGWKGGQVKERLMMQTISRKGDTGSSCCRQQKNQSILPLWRTPGHPPLPLPGDPLLHAAENPSRGAEDRKWPPRVGRPFDPRSEVWCRLPAAIQPGRTHETALLSHAGTLAAAAAAVVAAAISAAAAAAADQQDEDDDPAAVPAKETVITHTGTSYGVVGRGAGPTS